MASRSARENRELPFSRLQVEGAAVHAVPHAARLPGAVREDVAQMAIAARAAHFRPCHAVGAVLDHLHGARDRFGKARPPRSRFKLRAAFEQWIAAASAAVGAIL